MRESANKTKENYVLSEERSLQTKHRPLMLEDVVGNETTVKAVRTIMQREIIPPSFLFTGPTGTGKTTMALILKSILGCSEMDYKFYDTANTRGIDTIRDLGAKLEFKPMGGARKFYLIDECHQLTRDAQNALLKILEHPPPYAHFALCTTDPYKLLDTIRGRCHTFEMKSLPKYKIVKLLTDICAKEEADVPREVLSEIARVSDGSCRCAVRTLDQIIDLKPKDMIEGVQSGYISDATLKEICQLVIQTGDRFKDMAKLLKGVDAEQEQIRIGIMNYLTTVILNNPSDRIAEMISLFLEPSFNHGKLAGVTYSLYLACKL